jgi:hypothetical protein
MNFLKPYHEIILRDVILLDATKSANVLKKYWFIPLFLCRKELEKLAKDIFDAIGGEKITDISDDFEKLLSYRRIQLLQALFKAVQIEIGLKPRIIAWKIILEKDFKESPLLEEVLSEVKRITDIEIEKPEDVQTLFDYIQHKIDKHEEMFPGKVEEDGKSYSIVEVLNSVFHYFNLQPNESMLLITWVGMKKTAEAQSKQSNNQDNGE